LKVTKSCPRNQIRGYFLGVPVVAALANGRDLYALRFAANDRSNSLYMECRGNGVVIVSESLDMEPANWTLVPDNSAVIALDGEPARVVPLISDC
jgi:predicted glutamine amidotransferase